ncbi:hypothetical protein pipiens_000644, partial [Culex pipiens pipiens]
MKLDKSLGWRLTGRRTELRTSPTP